MEEKVKHKNISEAILAIYKEVGYVQKTGVNQTQKYKYAGEADLIAALRPVMLNHGVFVIPAGVNLQSYGGYRLTDASGNQKKTNRVVGTYKFDFTHTESCTSIEVFAIGEGVDNGDKAAYKAATGALKYALRQTFLIETGDEPEAHELTKTKPVFSSNAKRNDWSLKLEKLMEACPDVGELRAVWTDALPILTELKDSEQDYDQICYDHLVKKKDLIKKSIESLATDAHYLSA